MWNSKVAQIQQERRKKSFKVQVQKSGIIHASDVDRDISNLQELSAKWEVDFNRDQKIYLLILNHSIAIVATLNEEEKRGDRS